MVRFCLSVGSSSLEETALWAVQRWWPLASSNIRVWKQPSSLLAKPSMTTVPGNILITPSPEALSLKHSATLWWFEEDWLPILSHQEWNYLNCKDWEVWCRCWSRCALVGAPSNSKTWKLQPHGSRFTVRRKEFWDLQLWLRKALEAKCVSGVSMHACPQRPFVKLWRWTLDCVWDARILGCLTRKAEDWAWNQLKREKCVSQ